MCMYADWGCCISHVDGYRERNNNTSDELLEYIVGDGRPREIASKVYVASCLL